MMKKLRACSVIMGLATGCWAADGPSGSPVREHGQLSVKRTHLVNRRGKKVQLRGMSAFWLNYNGEFANYDSIRWLKRDWNISLYRAAIGVDVNNGYLQNPDGMMDKVEEIIKACERLGLYVIIDWHTHHAPDYLDVAKEFFDTISSKYGHLPNIIYEVWNEPEKVSWSQDIKPYVEELTDVIRANDPDNIILAGTPVWCSHPDAAIGDPLDDENTMYVLHFYSGSHRDSIRAKADAALDDGLPLFVSEFGVSHSDGGGQEDRNVYLDEADEWIEWMYRNKISWANWSITSKDEASAALKRGASPEGRWDEEDDLSASGQYIRSQLLSDRPVKR